MGVTPCEACLTCRSYIPEERFSLNQTYVAHCARGSVCFPNNGDVCSFRDEIFELGHKDGQAID
jgi:hypothetical protein